MLKMIETAAAPKPLSAYSQAIETAPGSRHVFVAGQIGARLDGSVPEDVEAQHHLAWSNALAILKEAGMDHRNIADAHVYITDRNHIGIYRKVRDEILAGHKPAATLLVVAGLADPKLVVEVSITAAAPA